MLQWTGLPLNAQTHRSLFIAQTVPGYVSRTTLHSDLLPPQGYFIFTGSSSFYWMTFHERISSCDKWYWELCRHGDDSSRLVLNVGKNPPDLTASYSGRFYYDRLEKLEYLPVRDLLILSCRRWSPETKTPCSLVGRTRHWKKVIYKCR